jgi:hypothetical protein
MGSIPTERFVRCNCAEIAASPSFYNVSRPITLKPTRPVIDGSERGEAAANP